jgi:hypothetical protein
MTETAFTVNSIPIKVFFRGDIRRFTLTGNFQSLRAQLQEILQISVENVSILYEDDEGDWITIGSESEFAYAIQLVGSRALRLRIVERTEPQPESSPSDRPWKEMKREAKMAKMEFKRERKAAKSEAKVGKKECKQPKGVFVARFVKHATVEDGSEFAPATRFVKTWRFRNEGTVAWPEKSALICVGKKADQLGATTDSVPIGRPVLPGEEVDVSVEMVAPSASGSYAGYWKLADQATGKKFGPRVRAHIKVVDSSSSSSDEGASSWGEMLTQLESMGFSNKAMNVKLLVKTHGNMEKVVRKLLKREEKMSGVNPKKF